MVRARFISGALLAGLLGVAPLGAQSPTGTVRGRVVDSATQQPLPGASITVGGHGTLTDAAGRYVITDVPAGAQTARASSLGYVDATQAVTVVAGGTATADFALATQALALRELVVVGYGTRRAGELTGSVRKVTPEEFNTGRVISPEQLIQSKVAGVQVVDNNEPGGGLSLRIRGATSINASSDPLYVVDGVPLAVGGGSAGGHNAIVNGGIAAGRNPLNFLNPEEIQSITVLKDASATAIYGSRGANGVVLIETKRGRRGTQIEYTGSMSASTVTRLPDMLNAQQFRAAVEQYAPQNVKQLSNANTDWFKLVDRNAFGQEHTLAISGVGDAMNYRFSLNYLNQDGVVRGTTTERIAAGLNYGQSFFDDHLDVRTSIKGSRAFDRFTPGAVLGEASQMGPTQPARDPSSRTGFYEWPGQQITAANNPLAELALVSDRGTTYRSIGNVQAEYRVGFLEGLTAHVNAGYDLTKATRETFSPSALQSQLESGDDGTAYRRTPTLGNTVFEGYLSYAAPLRALPGTVDLTGGYSYEQSHGEYPWIQAKGLSTDLLGNDGLPAARQVQSFLDVQDSKLISFFGRLNYNLNDRYLATVSVRRDGSSRFGPGNAWGTFPSVALAWRISQEPFMKGFTALSDLKLRGSWGKNGNQAFDNYRQFSTYLVGDAQTQAQFGDQFVTTIRPSAADPDIRWEATSSWDFGVDFALRDARVTGGIDVYKKTTNDLIFTVPIAAGTNLSNFLTTNIGSMENRGIELSLGARILDGGDDGLSWVADFNAAHNANELVSINPTAGASQQILVGGISGGVGTTIQVLQPDYPINSFFVYKHLRDGNGKPIYKDINGLDKDGHLTGKPDGVINEQDLYEDVNRDKIINTADRRPFHDPAPAWILGHSSRFAYRHLDLSFTLRAYLGNYVYNNVASNLGTYEEVGRGSPYNLHSSVLETGFEHPQYFSDYYVENASFLRMDNLTLGYTFRYRNQPMRIFATVQNAFTATGYSGVDPTAGLNGLDNNIYPRSRTFTGGVSVQF